MPDEKNQSDLSLLTEYSKALSQSATSLLEAAKSFEKTSKSFTSNLDKEGKEFTEDLSDEFEKYSKSLESRVTKAKAVGNAFIKSLTSVASYFIKDFTSAYRKVSESYEANLTEITVKQRLMNSQYTRQLNDITSKIISSGLNRQFSQTDWAESLKDVLSQGIRGETANEMAYRNMIANKLLPALNTNTRAYVRMSKQFGESFDKNMLAFGKYTESVIGAQAQETGTIQTILEQYEVRIKGLGYDTKKTNDIINMMSATAEVALKRGARESDVLKVYSDLYEGLTNFNPAGNRALSMAGGGTPGQIEKALQDPEAFLGLFTNYIRVLGRQASSGANANAILASELGYGSSDFALDMFRISEGFKDEVQEIIKGYEGTEREYQKLLDELESGLGASATTQYEKWMENTVAPVANTISTYVPNSYEAIEAIWKILGLWFGAWTVSSKGGGGLLKSFLNIGNRTPWSSISFSEAVGAGGSSPLAAIKGAGSVGGAILNLLAGPGALVGGSALAVKDSILGGIAAQNAGQGTGGIILGSLRGLLTGGTADSALTSQSKLQAALQGQGVQFNAGEMLANAGKGALLGMGIGTAAGGWAAGAGTAIGTAVGGAVGAAVNAVDQLVENAKYNKLADATNNLTESINHLNAATSNYQSTVDKSNRVEKAWSVIKNTENKGTKEYLSALEELKSIYPEYSKSLESLTGKEDQLEKILHARIDAELAMSGSKVLSGLDTNLTDLKSYSQSVKGIQSKYVHEGFSSAIGESQYNEIRHKIATAGLTGDDSQDYRMGESVVREVLESYGQVADPKTVHDLAKFHIDTMRGVSSDTYAYYQNMEANPFGIYGYQEEEWARYIEENKDSLVKAAEAYTSATSAMHTILSAFYDYEGSPRTNLTKNSPQVLLYNSAKDRLLEIAKLYNEMIVSVYGPSGSRVSSSDEFGDELSGLSEFASIGIKPFRYKVGSYNIGEDNTPALLHAGEMVLTSADADALRELASGQGVRGFLRGLKTIASATPTDDITARSSTIIVQAISSQTEILSQHLLSILSEIKSLTTSLRADRPTSTAPQNLIKYRGI